MHQRIAELEEDLEIRAKQNDHDKVSEDPKGKTNREKVLTMLNKNTEVQRKNLSQENKIKEIYPGLGVALL